MAKQKYALNPGEKIVYKTSCVRHGFWGAYTHALTITNQSVILEKYGMLNNFKGIERFDYTVINQAIQGEASNGEKQLELYIGDKVEDFALQSGDDNELKVLVMAINDQMGPDAEYYDFNYYQDIVTEAKDTDRILELRAKAQDEAPVSGTGGSGLEFAGAAAKNILKSGDFSAKGLTKAVTKATGKQKKKGIFSGMMDEFLDDIGIRDLQDEFIEMGNEFREEFGLKTKMTHAERKELEELEEKRRKQEIQKQKNAAFQDRVTQQKAKVDAQKGRTVEAQTQSTSNAQMSVKEQMELLQQIKSLLDAGVLTQEEFEAKKKEILNG
ncbi:Short C-terminal domain-containing protein [Lachnospiraceae bacterium C10]|nr:Short C-terminal domain-containing protein [Lachnospiraceae bacterium C10]